jgi:hypothetical protein
LLPPKRASLSFPLLFLFRLDVDVAVVFDFVFVFCSLLFTFRPRRFTMVNVE